VLFRSGERKAEGYEDKNGFHYGKNPDDH